ncbi:hypothetical protein Ptr902_08280 [Pyrenophora tritici-repentis]|nr:hypothetical protein Ptr902_08280 [Pyrenophora tritici-repentis]
MDLFLDGRALGPHSQIFIALTTQDAGNSEVQTFRNCDLARWPKYRGEQQLCSSQPTDKIS